MAKRKSRFMVGLFVTAGVLLGVTAVVWLGASNYLEAGKLYVIYFDESVQGLQVDSRVKYRGVDVGKVQQIGVASDQKLVEVIVKIDLAGEAEKNMVAQLRAAGITGIVFVELDRRNPKDLVLLPPPDVQSPYPAIPSQTSQTKQMLSSVDRIMERMEQVDLKGISDQVKQTSQAMETFLAGRQMRSILANIDSTTQSLDRAIRRVDALLAEKKIAGILDETRSGLGETREGIAETRRLVADLRAEVASLKAGEIAEKAKVLMESLDRRTRGMSLELDETTEGIREAVESLRQLIDRLRANPSDLLFSSPDRDDSDRGGR
ncbi:MAG: MlaD family protein [Deltaproteobacteria bacterium]|nr:MlaD family protein [Deltaproteobacteria bacterium]